MDPNNSRGRAPDPRDPRGRDQASIYRPQQQQGMIRGPGGTQRVGSGDSNEHHNPRGYTGHNTNRGYNNNTNQGVMGGGGHHYQRGSSFDGTPPTSRHNTNPNPNNNNNQGSIGGRSWGNNNTPYRSGGPNNNKEREMLNIYGGGGGSSEPASHGNIQQNDSFEGNQTSGSGNQPRKFANPCRFVGHDHDWKDCPNNFRNKKKTMGRGMGGGVGHPRDLGMGRGRGMVRMENRDRLTVDISHDAPGHYGPASATKKSDDRGGMLQPDSRGSMDGKSRGRPSLDRGISSGSGLGLSSSHSRGKSFGADDYHQPRAGSNERGGGRMGQPPGEHRRQGSWTAAQQRGYGPGGERGEMSGEGHFQRSPKPQQQYLQNPPHSSSSHHQQNHGSSYGGVGSHNQLQQPPLPSPTTSNSRGYSFTPQSMKRSRSTGFDHRGDAHHHHHHTTAAPSSVERRISAPQLHSASPGEIRSPPFSRTNSSPGEIRTAEKVMKRNFHHHPQQPQPQHQQQQQQQQQHQYQHQHNRDEDGEEEGGEIMEDLFESPSPNKSDNNRVGSGHSNTLSVNAAAANSNAATTSPRGGTPRGYAALANNSALVASPRGYATFAPPAVETQEKKMGEDEIGEGVSQVVPKKLAQTPHPSAAAAAEAAKKAIEEQDRPSLTCTSLKDFDKISKAQDIVAAMVELADYDSVSTDLGDVALPSKMQITQSMQVIESKIKLKGKEAMTKRKEVKACEAEEKAEVERKKREEQERLLKVEHDFVMREKNRKGSVSSKKAELKGVVKGLKSSLTEKRNLEVSRLKEQQDSKFSTKNEGVDAHIETLYTQLHTAEQQIADIDAVQLQREIQLSASQYGSDAAHSIIMAEDNSTHDGTNIHTLDFPGKMSGLVGSVLIENQMIAKRAHMEVLDCIPYFPEAGEATKKEEEGMEGEDVSEEARKKEISNEEWSNRARKVTGQHDALYNDPTEVLYYKENNARFVELAPRIKDCIRRKNKSLKKRWSSLADQYVMRQMIYNETAGINGDVSERGGYHSLAGALSHRGGNNDNIYSPLSNAGGGDTPGGGSELGVRGNNPYRRQRRGISPGDVVRSDYEQEQIIAEIAAKEAMEKRIKEGGCSLPRQQGWLENQLYTSYSNGFFGKEIPDYLADEDERRHINMWSDMEKCIYLDRFLHHPKDFRKISSFLKNKSTKDCVAFYYDSKKTVPYKHALKEFIQRKKRRGDVVSWDATIQAFLAMGAIVKAGTSPEQPLNFILPEHDFTYHTRNFQPMRLEVFEHLEQVVAHAKQPLDESVKTSNKRKRSNWFILDAHEKKFLNSSDDHHHSKRKLSTTEASSSAAASASAMDTNSEDETPKEKQGKNKRMKHGAENEGGEKKEKRTHKAQKWKVREKELFYDALDKHGYDWQKISEALGTRTPTQVKNYFHDNKEKINKTIEKMAKSKAAEGKKKKKTKKKATASTVDNSTPLSQTPTSDNNESSGVGTSGDSTRGSYTPTELQHAGGMVEQDEQYRQQLRLHLQDQLRQQIMQQHMQQQQHAQRQEELFRLAQEENYRQHLMQQAHQAQQLQQQQQQQSSGQNIQQLQNLQAMLAMRHSGQSQGFPVQQEQREEQVQNVYQAAAAAGIPASALEALARQHMIQDPNQQSTPENEHQNQEVLQLLLQRLAQQQQQQQQARNNFQYQR